MHRAAIRSTPAHADALRQIAGLPPTGPGDRLLGQVVVPLLVAIVLASLVDAASRALRGEPVVRTRPRQVLWALALAGYAAAAVVGVRRTATHVIALTALLLALAADALTARSRSRRPPR